MKSKIIFLSLFAVLLWSSCESGEEGKQPQTISFDPPKEWQLSRDGQTLDLSATVSSGLNVKFTLSGAKVGYLIKENRIYFYHAGETSEMRQNYGHMSYDEKIIVTASQEGDDRYSAANNVVKEIRVIGDVSH